MTTEENLFPLYSVYCARLQKYILFTRNQLNNSIQQYIYNRHTSGFELIEEPEFKFDPTKTQSASHVFFTADATETHGVAVVMRDAITGKIRKERFNKEKQCFEKVPSFPLRQFIDISHIYSMPYVYPSTEVNRKRNAELENPQVPTKRESLPEFSESLQKSIEDISQRFYQKMEILSEPLQNPTPVTKALNSIMAETNESRRQFDEALKEYEENVRKQADWCLILRSINKFGPIRKQIEKELEEKNKLAAQETEKINTIKTEDSIDQEMDNLRINDNFYFDPIPPSPSSQTSEGLEFVEMSDLDGFFQEAEN